MAPLTRLQARAVAEIKPGNLMGVLGFSFTDEWRDAVLRAEDLRLDGKVCGLRSSTA